MQIPPPESGNTRRLLAIMFTDIKGYSDMMGADEQATVAKVLEHREIVRAAIARFDGHEHETIGDAFVVLFESVVNAVKCAIEVQKRLAERNVGKDEADQVWIRIAIHLGDIILRDGGIYGDAVNLAARVEGRARPGGVCITEQVRLQIKGRIDIAMSSIGTLPLKGIRYPPELFRLELPTERGGESELPVASSASAGRRLIIAAAVIVLAVGAAFAVNSARSDADTARTATRGRTIRPVVVPEGTPPARMIVPASRAADAGRTAGSETAASRTAGSDAAGRQHAIVTAARDMARDKVAAAMAEKGRRRVQLLTEAATLDPDNKVIATMLAAARDKLASRSSHPRRARARPPTAGPTRPRAVATPAGRPTPAERSDKRTIQPHVVLD